MSDSAPVLGIVSAGQLARMTIQAAISLDVELRLLSAGPDDSAAKVTPRVEVAPVFTQDVLERFARGCDVVTFDDELVPPDVLRVLEAAGHMLRPPPAAKLFAQDKLHQRRGLSALGVPVPAFRALDGLSDLEAFGREHGWPIVAKAVRGGYDGRGVWVLEDAAAGERLWREAGAAGTRLLVEEHVPIVRELAALVARRPSGQSVTYAVVETVQRDGMCRELLVPAAVAPEVAREAVALGGRIAEAIGAVGILAVELFETAEGLLVNELALRPHNSGHWTIEGAATSQFENHIRAVLDWPLGVTELAAPAVATVNVVGAAHGGDPRAALAAALAVPGARVHLYGKSARPGRKLGHVTVVGDRIDDARERANRAVAILTAGGEG